MIGLAKIADTLSEESVCERWIYSSCLCFAVDLEEQQQSGFRYQYSSYQVESSRNLRFELGGQMERVFQALIDRSRAPLDLDTWPPPSNSGLHADHRTPPRWTVTTKPSVSVWRAFSANLE